MPADDFTKVLPRQKHEEFSRQLHLTDISHLLTNEKKDDETAQASRCYDWGCRRHYHQSNYVWSLSYMIPRVSYPSWLNCSKVKGIMKYREPKKLNISKRGERSDVPLPRMFPMRGRRTCEKKEDWRITRCLTLLKRAHTLRKACYFHLRWLTSDLDLMTNQLNEIRLRQRLQFINANRLRIDNLKMKISTYSWFRKNHRSARFTNVLRSYRFFHQKWPNFVLDTSSDSN